MPFPRDNDINNSLIGLALPQLAGKMVHFLSTLACVYVAHLVTAWQSESIVFHSPPGDCMVTLRW